jgi:membrane fusion protein, multidrug efflux system
MWMIGRMAWVVTLGSLALGLGGCGQVEPTTPAPEVARPVEILEIAASGSISDLRFPGRVRATRRAELSFSVGGKLQELPVEEGQSVAAGALIARLDASAYRNKLAAAQAEFEKARVDHERVRTVWEQSQAVARAEVDQKRTIMEVARSSFNAARKDVDDTRLTAPFAGIVARRYVENFSSVQANETIVSLQDPRQLEVVINVPERVMRGEPRRAAGYAIFEGRTEQRIPVTLKSFATDADPQTQTYEVVLDFARPPGLTVLPGMSATVFPEEAPAAAAAELVMVPLKAVLAGSSGEPQVWIVDPTTSRVSRRSVQTGAVRDGEIVVLAGLEPGERIVTAGVHHLLDGMLVRPL